MQTSARTSEQAWRDRLAKQSYFDPSTSMDVYHMAFQYAMTARRVVPSGTTFEDIEPVLAKHWTTYRQRTGVPWEKIRAAVEDVWTRAHELAADDAGMHGRFNEPPTFTRHGDGTPRNIDEPNR
jgi:hypothetical protein